MFHPVIKRCLEPSYQEKMCDEIQKCLPQNPTAVFQASVVLRAKAAAYQTPTPDPKPLKEKPRDRKKQEGRKGATHLNLQHVPKLESQNWRCKAASELSTQTENQWVGGVGKTLKIVLS